MTNKEFLQWIHDRLVHKHWENPDYDYMHRLRDIIEATPEYQPVTTSFVQVVPDKCDRIVWRNRYIHLPISQEPKQ